MFEFFVVRFTNRTDGTAGNVIHAFKEETEALKDYFREVGKAVDSTHLTDSVSLMTKEGFEVKHECFFHAPEPTPEPEPEPEPEEPTEE